MESGLLSVKDRSDIDVIQVKQASEIMEIYQMLRDGELNYDTVCLDSISEMSEILLQQEKEGAEGQPYCPLREAALRV